MNCSYPIYDFCLWCGEDKELFLTFSYIDSEGTRQPMVLDNCRFEMTLIFKRSREVLDRLTSEAGRLVPGVLEDGVFTESSKDATVLQVLFPHDVTMQFDETEAFYELFKIDSANKWEMLLAGKLLSMVAVMSKKIDFEVVMPKKVSVQVVEPNSPAAEVRLPGKPGKDGYTPVRGVDYFTPEDIETIADAVAARFVDGDKEAY